MWVTESGMVNFAKDLQPTKVSLAMPVTEFGTIKSTTEQQPAKAAKPMW